MKRPGVLALLRGARERGYRYDAYKARRACHFIETHCRHHKGKHAGHLFKLEPWQRRMVRRIYGWLEQNEDGEWVRVVRTVFLFTARKNGKSKIGSAVAMLGLYADGVGFGEDAEICEPAAEVISAAGDREQAKLIYNETRESVESDPDLHAMTDCYRSSMAVMETASNYKAISSEAYTKHGYNSSTVLVDELHAFPDRELLDVLRTGTVNRRQPLIFIMTTAGYDKHSVCYEYYDYAKKVEDGSIEDWTFYPVIFEAGPDDDWRSPQTWKKANPNLGITVSESALKKECQMAEDVPAYENTFKRLHLNIWTEQEERWFNIDRWDACERGYSEEELLGQRCYAGLDLSSTQDLTALSLMFPLEDGEYATLAYFWCPQDGITGRSKRDKVPYDVWARQGYLEALPGAVISYDRVKAKIHELAEKFEIVEIAVDKYNAIQLITQLELEGFLVCGYSQGMISMSGPSKELLSLILSERIQQNGHPVLKWCFSNVQIEQDHVGNIRPSKKRSSEKIDGVTALVMATARCAVAQPVVESVYKKRGLLVL